MNVTTINPTFEAELQVRIGEPAQFAGGFVRKLKVSDACIQIDAVTDDERGAFVELVVEGDAMANPVALWLDPATARRLGRALIERADG